MGVEKEGGRRGGGEEGEGKRDIICRTARTVTGPGSVICGQSEHAKSRRENGRRKGKLRMKEEGKGEEEGRDREWKKKIHLGGRNAYTSTCTHEKKI